MIDQTTRERDVRVQILLVSGEQENTAPRFGDAYATYVARVGVAPRLIIVHVGGSYRTFADDLTGRGIEVLRYEFNGDYYSLPNVLPLLALPSRAELVDTIMACALPRRPAA